MPPRRSRARGRAHPASQPLPPHPPAQPPTAPRSARRRPAAPPTSPASPSASPSASSASSASRRAPPQSARRIAPQRLTAAALLLHVALALLCARAAHAAKEFKYNAGGFAIDGFQTDPMSIVRGPNLYYRGPAISGLTVGRSHRWGEAEGFTYEFPVDSAVDYDVDLIFAEIYEPNAKAGARMFNIAVEDEDEVVDFDVFKEAGNAINKEVTETFKKVRVEDGKLSIAFRRGRSENPMVSAIVIRRTDKKDFDISDLVDVEGVGKEQDAVENKGFDHQAHAIAAGPYEETDYNDDGTAEVLLDGSGSHSHYFNSATGESGRIVRYLWTIKSSDDLIVLGRKQKSKAVFTVGTHNVDLEVEDQKGDVAKARTRVVVKPATSAGAYCYYYDQVKELPRKLTSNPKPVEGYSINLIDFSEDEFQYSKKASTEGTGNWAVRCISDFLSTNTTRYDFSVKFRGFGAELWINDGLKATSTERSGKMQTIGAKVVLPVGRVPIQINYYAGTNNPSLSFLADGKVAPPNVLSYKAAEVVPTIASVSTDQVRPAGGGSMTIVGTGFFNKLIVNVGAVRVTTGTKPDGEPSILKISGTEIILRNIPSAAAAKAGDDGAAITVSNGYSSSNSVTLTYSSSARTGVVWEQTFFKDGKGDRLSIKQVTGVKLGPDQQYYMSSLAGRVYKLQVGRDLQVKNSCSSQNLKRPILGLAFDYGSNDLDLYVTTSSLYWFFGGEYKNQQDGWANGAVERFRGTSGCDCLCYDRKIITGLPVSNHDHGVNGIEIKDGSMYISVGGATNAGHNTPNNKLGGWPESPLSSAVVTANFRKSGFNGKIRYDQYTDPESAKVTGGDVSVYSSGLRNSFGITMRLNGELWATDNGGNPGGYGDRATGCGADDFAPYTGKDNDKIMLLKKGAFFGHPNRARGQCSPKGATPANKEMVSATSGIAEYTANSFGNALLRHLIFTKYAAEGSGVASQSAVGAGGKIDPKQMQPYSGVAVTTGLFGELVMPRVQQGFIAVLRPDTTYTGAAPFVTAVSPPRGRPGKKIVITGLKFDTAATATVSFGSKAATGVKVRNKFEVECTIPSGSGVVGVSVTMDGVSSKGNGEAPFRYEG